ncbi:hypothetical protein, partial [Acinetobacter baumannii]|uniref:hypothetical protein n=1 Tax=Acinetobacter baumannii TaxID=470 RepID=UPI001897D582
MSTYEIAVKGRVHGVHLRALEGFVVVPGRTGETCFRGEIDDQEALHRVLGRIAGFNLELASVK